MKPVVKQFDLVEKHKHELNRKQDDDDKPLDDRALTEI